MFALCVLYQATNTIQNIECCLFFLSVHLFMFLCDSPLGLLVFVILTVFESPVHDIANDRRGDQTQKLEHTKDGRIDAH